MAQNEIVMRLGGEGGEGVISAGDIFTLGAARSGYHVFTFRSYPPEIKGGHAWYQIRVGSGPVRSIGDRVDVLIAFNAEAYRRHKGQLNEGGVLLYDPAEVKLEADASLTHYPVPFEEMARQQLNFHRGKNVVVVGTIAGLFGLDPGSLEGLIKSRFRRRPELLDQNLKALYTGYEYATKRLTKADPFYLTEVEPEARLVMSGNEAVVAGALASGCRFFAGYPITPASEILEGMARDLPRYGGVSIQAEDEIASLGMVLGASYTGVKAMTATSGPGLSLMTEFMGWSSMAEVPCVIVDVQRTGPSTGMPTKLEQGDLNHVLFGGHGDFPRIVIAPGSVEDALVQTVNAFTMAERYQMPTVLLSDQSLSHRTETLKRPDPERLKVEERATPLPDHLKNDFKRYELTPSGVSPMSLPGMKGGEYVAPGLEHDEAASIEDLMTKDAHVAMQRKRFQKLEAAQDGLEAPPRYGHPKAELGVIGWGSTEGVIQEAVERAVAKGIRVAAMHPKCLSPLPEKELDSFIRSVNRVLVPELNHTSQFGRYLRSIFGMDFVPINKYNGMPFTAGEVLKKIEEMASHG